MSSPSQEMFLEQFDSDIEAAYESFYPYDRYEVDSFILRNYDRFGSISESTDSQRVAAARKASTLLAARYKELIVQNKAGAETDFDDYDANNPIYTVADEWKRRYLDRRLEDASPTDYDNWVVGMVQSGLLKVGSDYRKITPAAFSLYNEVKLAVGDIDLVPLYGASAVEIVCPPNVVVSGNAGHTIVHDWNRQKPFEPYEEPYIYRSTAALLHDVELLPPELAQSLTDFEIQATRSKRIEATE